MKIDCRKAINNGFIFRYLTTAISLIAVTMNTDASFIKKYMNIILIILLILLDDADNIFLISDKLYNKPSDRCAKSFHYQYLDKINDLLSYGLVYILLFNSDYILLSLILYRVIGVILFSMTKDSKWLIIFFDFIKEYLLYLYLFGNDYRYIAVFILSKIGFEYFHHTITNPNNYKLKAMSGQIQTNEK